MAITKEKLQELIEQGATIYWICGKNIEKKPLKHKYHKFCVVDNGMIYEDNEKLGIGIWKHKLSKLFETKEEAEWHKEFGCIERTERLELPSWKEFEKDSVVYFIDKQGYNWDFYITDDKTSIILINGYEHYEFEFTKENYTLACRKAKELFLGEKDE